MKIDPAMYMKTNGTLTKCLAKSRFFSALDLPCACPKHCAPPIRAEFSSPSPKHFRSARRSLPSGRVTKNQETRLERRAIRPRQVAEPARGRERVGALPRR